MEFKYRKTDDWLVFEFEARRATIGGIQISEGLRLLDSNFHCSYLESRGVPEKTREMRVKSAGNYLPFISGFLFTISGDATSGDVISGDATSAHFR